MEQIKTFALMLVFCAAAGFVYYLLLPSGGVSRTAKGVLSAVLLLCVLSPLFSFLHLQTPSFAPQQESAADGGAAALLEESVRRRIEQTVRDTAAAFTDLPYETEITVHITQDYGINIETVRLIFGTEFPERAALREALAERLGFPAAVELREDE